MISLDISILYQAILFVILWLVLDKVLFRPYLKLLEEREHRTTGAQHDSADLLREGAQLRAQYQEKIAQAQSAGYAAKDAILQTAREEREKLLGQARQEAGGYLERMRQEIAGAVERERPLGDAEATAVAADMVSKVLGRKVA
jgi:F-type H+-transporting ATPase subunit b